LISRQPYKGLFKKSPPYFVLPSASRCILHFVRDGASGCHPEARKCRGTPLASLGATKKVGSGRQKRGLGAIAGGLAQKFLVQPHLAKGFCSFSYACK